MTCRARSAGRATSTAKTARVTSFSILLLALCAAVPAAAKSNLEKPDLYIVWSRDHRVVLPISVLAASSTPPAPVLLPEEGKEIWFRHFVERYRPTVVVLVESGDDSAEREAAEALLTKAEDAVVSLRLKANPGSLALAAYERLVPIPDEGEAGPPIWLVDAHDYPTALLSAVAAGAEGGLLLPIGHEPREMENALAFAASRRSPVRWATGEPGGGAHTSTHEVIRAAAVRHEVSFETVSGAKALVTKAAEVFNEGAASTRRHVVMTNPSDTEGWFSPPRLSLLAPAFAIARRAPLVLTKGNPEDLEQDLKAYEEDHGRVSHVTLLGDYLALRMREMLDPDDLHEGVDKPRAFKVPSLAGVVDLAPAEYAVGRLAAEDVHDLSLQLGRILAPKRSFGGLSRPALMLANADEIFVMAELVSMATVNEMQNSGWEVSAHYGDSINRELIFEELPGKEVIIWTGHPRDLTVDYDIGVIEQRLDAALVFLQGCYTLDRNDPYVLVQQGAASVIGTYMAVYSASGSAFAKTVLDSMLYYGADQGEAMVHARNYLLAYVAMKKQRGHDDWRKTWRAALSFDLWGDPTATPVPPRQQPLRAPVRLVRNGDTLRFVVPERSHEQVMAGRYTLRTRPGGQLGAIYTRSDEWGEERRMQPFYFGWVDLPDHEAAPRIASEVPREEWVSLWAPHSRRLYLLAHNRAELTVGREGFVFRVEPVVEPVADAAADQPPGPESE